MNSILKILPQFNSEKFLKLGSTCLEMGCCIGCTLRYLGVRSAQNHITLKQFSYPISMKLESNEGHEFRPKNSSMTQSTVKALNESFVSEETPIHEASKEPAVVKDVCPACLGVMQTDLKALAQKGLEIFKSNDYQLENQTFNLSIRLPTQLIIRHQAMIHKLSDIDEDMPKPVEVKEIVKYMIRDEFVKVSSLQFDTNSPLTFTIYLCHEESENDYQFLNEIPEAKFHAKKSRKKGKVYYQGVSVDKVNRAMGLINKKHFEDHKQLPPPAVSTMPAIEEIFFMHSQMYVAGRYCKLQRHISNSKWVIGGKKMTEDSVEELIGNYLLDAFGAPSYKFSSSGREDSDVLMLGRGRPFYFEITNPKKAVHTPQEMKLLQEKINSSVNGKISVQDLQICTREDTNALKDSASTKSKGYQCMVELEEPVTLEELQKLSNTTNIELKQRNPTRVPRRADLIRDKLIEWIKIEPQNLQEGKASLLKVDLKTSAGTYVKEFVHGDEGRTVPSIATLLDCKSAKCLSLDVLEVFLDWPPKIE